MRLETQVGRRSDAKNDLSFSLDMEYVRLKRELDTEKKAFNNRIRRLEQRLKEIEMELREEARTLGVKRLGAVEFAPKMTRTIDPKAFVDFLAGISKEHEFFDFVSIPLTKAVGAFGERTLADAGVFLTEVDDYGRVLISDA